MPSPAAATFHALTSRVEIILRADRSALTRQEVQSLYGAAFVAQVAAWNSYVVALVRAFFLEAADPTITKFHAMHTLCNGAASSQLDRFSTPNAENTRNLLVSWTGYDPWPDWAWPSRGFSALDVRSRLNEILKVRHSFAHGFTTPGYTWNQSASGLTRLTVEVLLWTRAFFDHLVRATDAGLTAHLRRIYGAASSW